MPRTNYQWLRQSAEYHRRHPKHALSLEQARRFDAAADELREAHVGRIVAQNPGIDIDEVRASYERTQGAVANG